MAYYHENLDKFEGIVAHFNCTEIQNEEDVICEITLDAFLEVTELSYGDTFLL